MYSAEMDSSFIQARIDATKLQIVAFEDAAFAIGTGTIESYIMDTGQTRQNVTKLNLHLLSKAIDGLYNRCATLEARLNGSGVIIGKPGW